MPQDTTSQTQTVAEGDLVEVVLRGTVRQGDGGFFVGLTAGPGAVNFVTPEAEHVVSVTKVAAPWQEGDVIRVGGATRVPRFRSGDLAWVDASGMRHAEVDWYDSEHGYDYEAVIRGGQVVSS